MRVLALLPLLLAGAACGDSGSGNVAAPAAAALAPGQWELTSEVTGLNPLDHGAPKINTPVGTRATQQVCVGAGDQLPTLFFSGENYSCTYGTYYARNGMVNLTLNCTRPGLQGDIPMTINGTFQANNVDFHRNLRSALVTDGDVEIDAHVTGHRTGDCTAAAPGAPAARAAPAHGHH